MFHKRTFLRSFQGDFRSLHMGRGGEVHNRYNMYHKAYEKVLKHKGKHLVYEGRGQITQKVQKFDYYINQQSNLDPRIALLTPHRSNIHPATVQSFRSAIAQKDLSGALQVSGNPACGVQALHVFVDRESYVWGCFLVSDSVPASCADRAVMGSVGIWWYWSYTTPGSTTVTQATQSAQAAVEVAGGT